MMGLDHRILGLLREHTDLKAEERLKLTDKILLAVLIERESNG